MIITPNPFASLMGWGKVYNGGVGVTGGGTGDTLYFNESSLVNGQTGFMALWETIKLNLLTPLNLIWTGGTVTLDMVNYQIDTAEWSTTRVGSPKNKNIECSEGQLIENGTPRFRGWENIILRNFERRKSFNVSGNEGDGLSFLNCEGIWVDHIHINGEGTGSNEDNLIEDGGMDFTKGCNYISVSNCILEGIKKTILIGADNADTGDIGKNKISIYGSAMTRATIRTPFARFGQVHIFNCLWDWPIVPTFYSILHEVGIQAQIVSEKNDFKKFRGGFLDQEPEIQLGGILAIDNLIGTSSLSSPNTTGIRPENVTWFDSLPIDYAYTAISKNDVEDNVNQYAGAKFHLIVPPESEFNLTVQSSNETFGTVSRSLSNPVTAGATDVLTATPVGTGVFNGWYLGSVSFANFITNDNPYSRVVNSDATIIASFIDGTPIPPSGRKKWAKKRNEVV